VLSRAISVKTSANGWTAIWRAPFEDTVFRNDTAADPRQAILGADILGMGFGHIVPLPLESMLADGVGDTPGPALGCEGSPAATSAIGATSLDTVNIAALGAIAAPGDVALTLSGPAAADATAGTVILSDGGSSVFALAQGVADGGWTATFTKAQLEGLADGTLTATPSFETPTGAVNGSPLKIVKDTVAPTLDPTLPPGTYSGVQQVGLAAGGADKVTYSLDGATPQTYAGIPVELKAGTHTLTGTATDAAGNVTTASWTYAIDAPASAPPVAGPTARPTPTVTTTTVPSSRSLVVRDLHMRRSLRRSEIRRRGITASMRLAAGTRTVRIAVYRRVGPGELELVTRTVRTPGKGGAYRVRLGGNLRKALTPGRYVLVVTPGRSESRFVSADERQRSFRVTQR